MTLLFIIGLFVIVSLFVRCSTGCVLQDQSPDCDTLGVGGVAQVLCLFEDQCLRQDAGVMAEGAAAVFPLAGAVAVHMPASRCAKWSLTHVCD